MGQLLLQGYEQQWTNGKFLERAYMNRGDDGTDDDDEITALSMSLFLDVELDDAVQHPDKTQHHNDEEDDDAQNPNPDVFFEPPHLRFRADDDQRTLMSGQILLHALFEQEFTKHLEKQQELEALEISEQQDDDDSLDFVEGHPRGKEGRPHVGENGAAAGPPTSPYNFDYYHRHGGRFRKRPDRMQINIPLHTADRPLDILDANPAWCPEILKAKDEAIRSNEYQTKFVKSAKAKSILAFYKNKLGMKAGSDGDTKMSLDCLFTTICTDRTLPDYLNDYNNLTANDSTTTTPSGVASMFETIMKFVRKEVHSRNLYSKKNRSNKKMMKK
mmetsp:Transcript_10813/g.16510  ORF Transcript_10813/g.16510 Transcript_10813/m.16510 type:complete len:330 (+) Transcript_10813:129-1118(+)